VPVCGAVLDTLPKTQLDKRARTVQMQKMLGVFRLQKVCVHRTNPPTRWRNGRHFDRRWTEVIGPRGCVQCGAEPTRFEK